MTERTVDTTADAWVADCDHVGTRRFHRVAHGFLGDAPKGTRQTFCVACAAEVDA